MLMSSHGPILTEADNARTVEARVGDMLAIRLHENASTGYRWSPDKLNPAITLTAGGYEAQEADAVGSGGTVQWTLKANTPGTFQIDLKLWRHWEGDKSVQKRFRITLLVKP